MPAIEQMMPRTIAVQTSDGVTLVRWPAPRL